MDAQEMDQKLKEDPNYVPTLEDEVEAQRQLKVAELKASGLSGTPVTPETFQLWQEGKRKRRAEMEKKLVEAELKKKKGKGLSVLSGRALYEYKRDLFLDDDAATEGLEFGDDGNDGNEEETNGERNPSVDMDGVEQVVSRVQSELSLNNGGVFDDETATDGLVFGDEVEEGV